MPKDPAFLFYSQDFIMGTMFMTNEQVGIYIKLLCCQHQHGGLIDKDSFNSMVQDNEIVRKKFVETDDGFFNERLIIEMERRAVKSTNMSANAKKRWEKHSKSNAKASAKHIPIETENENETEDNNSIIKPTHEELVAYCKERKNNVNPVEFYNYYESVGWKVGKNKKPMKSWKATIRTWEQRGNNFSNIVSETAQKLPSVKQTNDYVDESEIENA